LIDGHNRFAIRESGGLAQKNIGYFAFAHGRDRAVRRDYGDDVRLPYRTAQAQGDARDCQSDAVKVWHETIRQNTKSTVALTTVTLPPG
jgi:hypothetical protein